MATPASSGSTACFAFAIGDENARRVLLARDRLGKKAAVSRHARRRAPLRVGDQGDQGQPVLERRAGSRGDRRISVARLFHRAAKQPIGTCASWSPDTCSPNGGREYPIRKYWDIQDFDSNTHARAELLDEVGARLSAAVSRRLES
jgi:asparagine synthetase B (glutamine-hydrolysing)